MRGIDDALKVAGDDSMRKLFEFVAMRMELSDPNENIIEWAQSLRMASDVGLAIYEYALNKERICRE